MTSENKELQNGGSDLAVVIRAALPPREDLRLTPQDGVELAATYRTILHDYREHGARYLESGDYKQAAEKCWGSYAESVKSIAADQGFRLSHHGHIVRVGGALSDLADRDNTEEGRVLREGLGLARSLHQHFYENDLPAGDVVFSSGKVAAAIDLMQQRFSATSNGT
jgi:hypothetical protein